jgi:sec-independent protein translocase protein TatC
MKKKAAEDASEGRLPFTAHLIELRSRLVKSLIAVIIGFCVAYTYSQQLFEFIIMPLKEGMPPGGVITMLEVTEGFMTLLKVALWGGMLLACPVIFYQLWSFISPGLQIKEKRYVVPFVIVSTAFFTAGAAFCYFIAMPFALKFLLAIAGPMIQPSISVGKYLGFALNFMLAFGCIFEMPVLVFVLSKVGLINYKMLIKWHGMAIIGITITAALLTPTPDAFSMLIMGVPLYFLYLFSIVVAWVFGKRGSQLDKEEEEVEE